MKKDDKQGMGSSMEKTGGTKTRACGYFPLEFFIDFLEFLHSNRDMIEVLTYDDLNWGNDFKYQDSYPLEWKNWKKQLKEGDKAPDKIYLLLQHDVDNFPDRTLKILHEEERLGFRSNVMLFWRRINRRHLKKSGELLQTEYDLDFEELQRLEKKGFVFCYHCNSFERALFDVEKAMEIFEADVEALRKHLDIHYFSPHGGARSPDGKSNNSLPVPEPLRTSIRWVANGRTIRLRASFSDGGLKSPKRDPSKRDLRDFVRTWRQGERYRVLTHPQYYCSPCGVSPRLAEASWYRDMLEFYNTKHRGSAWSGVNLRPTGGHSIRWRKQKGAW